MIRSFLIRGLLAGLAGGLLAFVFARFFGEAPVDSAIAFESQAAAAAGEMAEPEVVSRAVQASLGLFVGVVLYSTALGGLFALSFAFAWGRVGRLGPRPTAALIGMAGFLSVILVPFLKFPANPPSIGLPETIQYRTELYIGMIVISIIALVAAINLARSLFGRLDPWYAVGIAALLYLAIVTLARFVLPDINEVPQAFPATLLWQFRIASLGTQLVLWTTTALVFGELAERSLSSRRGLATPLRKPL